MADELEEMADSSDVSPQPRPDQIPPLARRGQAAPATGSTKTKRKLAPLKKAEEIDDAMELASTTSQVSAPTTSVVVSEDRSLTSSGHWMMETPIDMTAEAHSPSPTTLQPTRPVVSPMISPTAAEAEELERNVLQKSAEMESEDQDHGSDRATPTTGHSRSSSHDAAGGFRALATSIDMRQKLRNRAKNLVEKSRGETKLTKRLQRRVSTIREQDLNNLDHESRIEEAMEKSAALRTKIEKQTQGSRTKNHLLTPSQQNDFFTKTYDVKKKPTTTSETARTAGTTDRDVEDPPDSLTRDFVKAETDGFFAQLKKEAKVYYYPSTDAVPQHEKLIGQPPRRISAEGLFTPAPIQCSEQSKNIWEQRLVNGPNKGLGWFDEAGRIKTMLSGLAQFPMRLELEERPELMQYCKATQGRRVQIDAQYQLDIDISKLQFVHHPLFSAEHVLASQLIGKYRVYISRCDDNTANKLDLQLKAQQLLIERFMNVSADVENSEQLKEMRVKLRQLRRDRNKELAADCKLMNDMIEIWTKIEELRQQQAFTSTPESVDVEADKHEWQEDLLDELYEIEDDYEDQTPNGAAPPEFNLEAVWQQISANALKNRRKSGEPKYVAVLNTSGAVTSVEECPPAEKQRRQAVTKCKYSLRIFFNGLDAAGIAERHLNSEEFSVTFGQIHTLHVHEQPHLIDIRIYEQGVDGRESTQLAVLGVPIPEVSQVTTEGENFLEEYEFGSEAVRTFEHAAVGAGIDIALGWQNRESTLYTSGILQCAASWARDKYGTPLAPPSGDEPTFAEEPNQSIIRELQQLYNSSTFDINDPVNARLAAIIKSSDLLSSKLTSKTMPGDIQIGTAEDPGVLAAARATAPDDEDTTFRTLLPELELMSEEDFYADVRFKLFEMRRKNVPEFRSIKMVPAYAAHIDQETFERYRKRVEKEKETERITGLDSLRAAGHKFAAQIKQQVQSRFIDGEAGKAYEDVVREVHMPEFIFSFGAMCAGGPVERPLRPVRKTERRGSSFQSAQPGSVKLLVNMQTASNIPTRITTDEKTTSRPTPKGIEEFPNEVEPFFEVSFQGTTMTTSVVVGKNPTWQQLIQFDFKAPNDDFSPESLKAVSDILTLNLFDQVVSKLPKDDREGVNTVREQIEKRWLGSIQLPFSTLYFNGKIDGSLRMKVPPVYLGYNLSRTDDGKPIYPYIKLLLAIEPPLPLPETPQTNYETVETDAILRTTEKWLSLVKSRFPKRRYSPLVLDTHGRSVLVSRFLNPIEPPAEVRAIEDDQRKAVKLACHIASLIPFVADYTQFPGLCDIWSTCDEFLLMLCGDEEEHSVLLCNWLLHMEIEAYLVLGNGLPEGPRSAYVLVKYGPSDYWLYNGSDGQVYSTDDAYCPLTTVGTLVSQKNVWANIQQHAHPSRMSFNLQNTHMWRPLLKEDGDVLDSVQPSHLVYTPTDAGSVAELRAHIEREIKMNFDQWRPHGIPQWDFNISRTLREILPEFEADTMTPDAHSERLQSVITAHKTMTGFPLNMPYETVDKVLQAVKATNVHVNFDVGVEFALGVYLHSYPNNILSLWVYIASISKDFSHRI